MALYHMDLCSVLCGSLNGRRVWGRMNTDICMVKSLGCLPETYITLLIGYSPIKIKLKKIIKVKAAQSCPTLCDPISIQSMEFSRPAYQSGQPFPFPGHLPNPEIEPWSPVLQADCLPAEPQGKPENIGVGSLSLLQQIVPTQGQNPGLLHCRPILYQLSQERSLKKINK